MEALNTPEKFDRQLLDDLEDVIRANDLEFRMKYIISLFQANVLDIRLSKLAWDLFVGLPYPDQFR